VSGSQGANQQKLLQQGDIVQLPWLQGGTIAAAAWVQVRVQVLLHAVGEPQHKLLQCRLPLAVRSAAITRLSCGGGGSNQAMREAPGLGLGQQGQGLEHQMLPSHSVDELQQWQQACRTEGVGVQGVSEV
jgi:hypothetical protein